MLKFYLRGKFIYTIKEKDETWPFFKERMAFLLRHSDVKSIDQYSFIYANKLFYGVLYPPQIEENLELIENVKLPSVPYMKLNIDSWPVKDIDLTLYMGNKTLIITERDLNVNADIWRIIKGNRSIYVSEFPKEKYDSVILYFSFPFIERYSSFFAKISEILNDDGFLIVIEDLILLDEDEEYYINVARTLLASFTHPRFYRQNLSNTIIRNEKFDLYESTQNIVTYSTTSIFRKEIYLPPNMFQRKPIIYEELDLEKIDLTKGNAFYIQARKEQIIILKKIAIANPEKKFYFT